jgi:hypothetical protein
MTQGGIGSALRADVIANNLRPDASSLALFEDCALYLSDHGEQFNAEYLRALHRAAVTTELEYYRDGWTHLAHPSQ